MNKTIDAASKQIDNIEFIQDRVGLQAYLKAARNRRITFGTSRGQLERARRNDSIRSDLEIRNQSRIRKINEFADHL